MVITNETHHMKYQIFLITKSFNIDWTYWIVPTILSSDERDKLLKKILFEDIFPYLPGIDVSTIAEVYGHNSGTGLWFNYAYFFPFNTKDILLLVKKAPEGVDIGGRGIWKFAGVVIDSNQREKQITRSLFDKFLNSPDLFQLTDGFYKFNARPPIEPTISKIYELSLDEDDISENGEGNIESKYLPEIKTEFGQRGYVTLNPSRANLDLLLNNISNTQNKIPYFLLGPFKKKGEYEQQSIISNPSKNTEGTQSSDLIGEDKYIDLMPPNMIDIPITDEGGSSLDPKDNEEVLREGVFEETGLHQIIEEEFNSQKISRGKNKMSAITFLRTVPIRIAIEAYEFTRRVFDKDKKQ